MTLCLAQRAVLDTRVACQLDQDHDGEHEARLGIDTAVAWWTYSPARIDRTEK